MSREDFFRNVRIAAGWVAPNVRTDSELLNEGAIEKALAGADLWLTRGAVEGYDPSDFTDLPDETRGELDTAVTAFLAVASEVPGNQPATKEQSEAGRNAFLRIIRLIREIVLGEWIPSVESLIADAESWAEKRQWPCRREPKDMEEKLLGSYQVPQLLIQVNGKTFLLDPVSRFTPGGKGVVDLALVPSYISFMIPRTDAGWQVHIDKGKREISAKREPWSEDTFARAVDLLRQRG